MGTVTPLRVGSILPGIDYYKRTLRETEFGKLSLNQNLKEQPDVATDHNLRMFHVANRTNTYTITLYTCISIPLS